MLCSWTFFLCCCLPACISISSARWISLGCDLSIGGSLPVSHFGIKLSLWCCRLSVSWSCISWGFRREQKMPICLLFGFARMWAPLATNRNFAQNLCSRGFWDDVPRVLPWGYGWWASGGYKAEGRFIFGRTTINKSFLFILFIKQTFWACKASFF